MWNMKGHKVQKRQTKTKKNKATRNTKLDVQNNSIRTKMRNEKQINLKWVKDSNLDTWRET